MDLLKNFDKVSSLFFRVLASDTSINNLKGARFIKGTIFLDRISDRDISNLMKPRSPEQHTLPTTLA